MLTNHGEFWQEIVRIPGDDTDSDPTYDGLSDSVTRPTVRLMASGSREGDEFQELAADYEIRLP